MSPESPEVKALPTSSEINSISRIGAGDRLANRPPSNPSYLKTRDLGKCVRIETFSYIKNRTYTPNTISSFSFLVYRFVSTRRIDNTSAFNEKKVLLMSNTGSTI